MILAASSDYPFLGVMWSMFVFFGLVIFFWMLFTVFGDLFRRDDIGGWGKTGWTVFVIVLPLIGTFTYLIAQGRAMAERENRRRAAARQQTDEYIRSVATGSRSSGIDAVARGKQLLDDGAISKDEFEAIKRDALV